MLLSEHRKARGLTLAQTAGALGLSAKSVGWLSDIENGKRDASLRLALRIERWSGGQVSAASVNREVREGVVSGHGVSSSCDGEVVAPGAELGAGAKLGIVQ